MVKSTGSCYRGSRFSSKYHMAAQAISSSNFRRSDAPLFPLDTRQAHGAHITHTINTTLMYIKFIIKRVLAFLLEDPGLVPSTQIGQLTNYQSSSRGSDTLFWETFLHVICLPTHN